MNNNNSISSFIRDIIIVNETYPPLSMKDERAMIAKLKDNREQLNEELVLHNMRLVFTLSNKYKHSCFDYDEMIQAGLHGLTIAASKFDINKKLKFSTYAAFWIRKYILQQFYNKHNTHINSSSISFDREFSTVDNHTMSDIITSSIDNEDYLPNTPEQSLEENDMTEMYKKLVDFVNSTEQFETIDKHIFNDHFIKHHTLTKVAKKVKRSVPLVLYRKKKIATKLKMMIESQYNITEFSQL